jgi:nucleoside-diphosphate-sugar epimerase
MVASTQFNLVVNHFIFWGLTDRLLTIYDDGSNYRPFIHVTDAALEPERMTTAAI